MIEGLIRSAGAQEMLARLATMAEKERRSCAALVRDLFKQWYATLGMAFDKPPAGVRDLDALRVAMLATATRAELRPYGVLAIPRSLPLVEVMRALSPSWLDGWVGDLVEDRPFSACALAPLWRSGLCRRPESDALILAYYNTFRSAELTEHPEFIEEHVWRFFEVEGGGDLSLAAHDKYCKRPENWSDALVRLAGTGELDRGRLLDASLDALERDFGQFRAGWYSRFHAALDPSLDEQSERCDRYVQLLASAVPPTVALALKALKALDKAGKLPLDDLLGAIRPALLARQKSAALAALQLLASAAKRSPERAPEIAGAALTALVSESAEVQGMALDLVDRLAAAGLPEVQAALAEHLDIVAPSVRARLATMLARPTCAIASEPAEERRREVAAIFVPVVPVASADEALGAYLQVLEDPRDPLAVERAMDGLSRFGAALAAGASQLSPLSKRAGQIFGTAGYQKIKLALAACGRGWCGEGMPGELVRDSRASHGVSGIADDSLAATFLERCDEIIARVRRGEALPLLSLPSDSSGRVRPADLVDRLDLYRASGAAPGTVDLALALTRLAREGRAAEAERVDRSDEAGEAVAFALGIGGAASGTGPLWAAAWLARSADVGDPEALWPTGEREPGAGATARHCLVVEKEGDESHYWCHPRVETAPGVRQPDRRIPAVLLHCRRKSGWGLSAHACGYEPADIAWSSLVMPADPEAFLANAIGALDTSQKLADHPCIAYLDAFDRLDGEPGPIGCAVLALYLASEDKSLCAHALDKVVRLAGEDRVPAERFAAAILPFMLVGTFPSMRWTRALAAVAETGPRHRKFARDVAAGLMGFDPARAPRDIGGMIELLYELQLASGTPFDDPGAIECLEGLDGGGKAAKFSARLLALRGEPASMRPAGASLPPLRAAC